MTAADIAAQLDTAIRQGADAAEINRLLADLRAARQSPRIELLADVKTFIRRFCAFPDEHAVTAITLWAAHTHMIEHFHTTPRLALLSPEPESGKTRVLEVLSLLVPECMLSISPSPATIFRKLANVQVTLLIDECDTIFTKRGKDDTNEDLRALLNSGYRRSARIPRCVGPRHEVVDFNVFCAVALAGLGELPDTILSRSIIVRMRRRSPDETIESFRMREHEACGYQLRDRLAEWSAEIGASVGAMWPALPSEIVDRSAEAWEPLISIADAAGGPWPKAAREAAVHFAKLTKSRRASLGTRLLSDLRLIFNDAEALHTETILYRLCNGDAYGLDADAPWADLHGRPITDRGLASLLKGYGVAPVKVKADGRSLQGYRREHLWDAWKRYVPTRSTNGAQAEPAEPAEPTMGNATSEAPDSDQQPSASRTYSPSNGECGSEGSAGSGWPGAWAHISS